MVAQWVGDWLRWSGIPTSGHLRISQATPNGMKAQVGEKGTESDPAGYRTGCSIHGKGCT